MDINPDNLLEMWTDEQFMAYALTYAAYADNQLRPEEYEAICEQVGTENAERANRLILKLNKTERTELLLRFKDRFFKDEGALEDMLGRMQEIFEADGRFCILEKSSVTFLRNVLS